MDFLDIHCHFPHFNKNIRVVFKDGKTIEGHCDTFTRKEDSDCNEPELTVEKIDDDKYKVFMGIYRLTTLNGIGELTKEGLTFTATDMAGNPISAIINVDEEKAVVTFTDSTWDYIENGDTYTYLRD